MIQSTFNLRQGFGAELAREINDQVRVGVAEAAEEGARVMSGEASRRRRTGRMSQVDTVPVVGTDSGWTGGFKSAAFSSGMQSRGTLGSRTRKVKASTERRRQSPSGQARHAKVSGGRGVSPLRHEENGLAAAKRYLVAFVNRITR